MKKLTSTLLTGMLFALLCMFVVLPACAGDGNGMSEGNSNPLSLVSSNPASGQKNVELPVEIRLSFSKNVINMTVKDKNRQCFALYNASGVRVPVEVIMADDQMEPEKKREVALKPLQELQPDTAYTVKVAPELQSKSSVTLGKGAIITFVTAGAAKSEKADNNSGDGETEIKPSIAGNVPTAEGGKPGTANVAVAGDNAMDNASVSGKDGEGKVGGSIAKGGITGVKIAVKPEEPGLTTPENAEKNVSSGVDNPAAGEMDSSATADTGLEKSGTSIVQEEKKNSKVGWVIPAATVLVLLVFAGLIYVKRKR